MTTSHKPDRDRKTFELARGLYVVRYSKSAEERFPPAVYISAAGHHITFVNHPDSERTMLTRPGSALVVRLERSDSVVVDIVASVPEGSIDAELDFEELAPGSEGSPASKADRVKVAHAHPGGIRVNAHVTAIGDISVEANEWLGGPLEPMRIEGLSLKWPDQPEGVVLMYGVRSALQPAATPINLVSDNRFAGTKGRSSGVTELVMEMQFPAFPTHKISGEAMFLGGNPIVFEGSKVRLHGPTGREALIGLKLHIVKLPIVAAVKRGVASAAGPNAAKTDAQIPSGSPAPSSSPEDQPSKVPQGTPENAPKAPPSGGRVRVFRA